MELSRGRKEKRHTCQMSTACQQERLLPASWPIGFEPFLATERLRRELPRFRDSRSFRQASRSPGKRARPPPSPSGRGSELRLQRYLSILGVRGRHGAKIIARSDLLSEAKGRPDSSQARVA